MIKARNKGVKMVYDMFKDGIGLSEKNITFGVRVGGNTGRIDYIPCN